MQVSLPFTVAGPRRTFTGLPLVSWPHIEFYRQGKSPAVKNTLPLGVIIVKNTLPDELVIILIKTGQQLKFFIPGNCCFTHLDQ